MKSLAFRKHDDPRPYAPNIVLYIRNEKFLDFDLIKVFADHGWDKVG